MRNFLIRIGDRDGEHYPVEALLQDGDDPAVLTPVGAASIPAAAVPAGCPALGQGGLAAAGGGALHALVCGDGLRPAWAAAVSASARLARRRARRAARAAMGTAPRRGRTAVAVQRRGRACGAGHHPVRTDTLAAPGAGPAARPGRGPGRDGHWRDDALGAHEELRAMYFGSRYLHCCWQVGVLFGASMPTCARSSRRSHRTCSTSSGTA